MHRTPHEGLEPRAVRQIRRPRRHVLRDECVHPRFALRRPLKRPDRRRDAPEARRAGRRRPRRVRVLTARQLQQRHPERPHVARRPVRVPAQALRRHVRKRAGLVVHARADVGGRVEHRRDAEVGDLHAPVVVEEQIARLDVAVHHAQFFMEEAQALKRVAGDITEHILITKARSCIGGGRPWQQLHENACCAGRAATSDTVYAHDSCAARAGVLPLALRKLHFSVSAVRLLLGVFADRLDRDIRGHRGCVFINRAIQELRLLKGAVWERERGRWSRRKASRC
mmetsp:Transcript_22477/g.69741  ORF Transcript_22477/g.69741 Transcript_22477/m.69741 type:complete len:283 (+) Transcript_22477:776-1624(+)